MAYSINGREKIEKGNRKTIRNVLIQILIRI